jgi:tetratricopeptide (TPR) repeat protein
MRLAHAAPALLLTCSLAAGTPWEDFVQRRRTSDPRLAKWVLCVRPGEFTTLDAAREPEFLKLLTSGDFLLETLTATAAQDLWQRKGWENKQHWLLLSPAGDEAGQGPGRPRADDLLNAIHNTGARARFEQREAFLREHPDQGEARLEALNIAFQVLRYRLMALDKEGKVRIPAWHQDPAARNGYVPPRVSLPPGQGEAMADELYAGVAEHLEKLLALPGWEREAGSLASQLSYWDTGQSFRLRKLWGRAASGLEQALREEPYDFEIANFWVEACDAAGQPPASLSGLCLPVPGSPWPDPGMVPRFLEPALRKRDWDGALKLLSDLAPQAPPEPMSARGWETYCRLQSSVLAQRGVAYAGQGSWELAGAALGEARHWGGSQGVREALLQRGALFTGPGGDPGPWRQMLMQALTREGEPPPMPAAPPPLRLVVSGMPRWILAWTALRSAPDLVWWSPAELRWEAADKATHDKRQAQHGWEPGPRWVLYRGEEPLATGQTCPNPRALAAMLETQGPPLLERLQRAIDAQDDHLAARRERYELLIRRMPDPRLEATLAEDAARALVTLDFDPEAPWQPDPDIWAAAAQKALPALEESLRAWPNRSYLWRAWISWARFHPSRPSALALAQSVSFWSPRSDWKAWLPFEVQRAVAAELRREKNFSAMREWFGSVWESLDRRPLRSLHRGEQQWVMERRREEETAVFQPLRDALTALGFTQEKDELERVFAEMVGREHRPPRAK